MRGYASLLVVGAVAIIGRETAWAQSEGPNCTSPEPGAAPTVLFKIVLDHNTKVGPWNDVRELSETILFSQGSLTRITDTPYDGHEGSGNLYVSSDFLASYGHLSGKLSTRTSHHVPGAGALATAENRPKVDVYIRVDTTVNWHIRTSIDVAMDAHTTDARQPFIDYSGYGPLVVQDVTQESPGSVGVIRDIAGSTGPNDWYATTFPEFPGVTYARIGWLRNNLWSGFAWGYCISAPPACPYPSYAETKIDESFTVDVTVGNCRRKNLADLLDYQYVREFDWADTSRLANSEATVRGFAADGVTPIVIRTPRFTCPGTVDITLADEYQSNEASDVGDLKDSPDGAIANPLSVQLRNIPGTEEWIGFAYLTAPMDFVRQAHYVEDAERGRINPRKLTACMRYCPTNGTCVDLPETTIELHRPPVLLLHGLHDDGDSWKWSLRTDPKYLVDNPSFPNANSFVFNGKLVRGFVNDLVIQAREQDNIAVTQVDVFGHSMGGILARWHWLDLAENYARPENFEKGDFHKLVTVNSPHLGSQVAALLVSKSGTPTHTGTLVHPFRNVTSGAVRDLRPDSNAIELLNSTEPRYSVLANLIISRSGTDYPGTSYWFEKAVPTLLCYTWPAPPGLVDFLLAEQYFQKMFHDVHDCAVGLYSQALGLLASAIQIDAAEGQHYPTIALHPHVLADDLARELLDAPSNSATWLVGGFPMTTVRLPLPDPCVVDLIFPSDGSQSGSVSSIGDFRPVEFVTPSELANAEPGENQFVAVEGGEAGVPTIVVLATSAGAIQYLTGPPFEAQVSVPIEAVGRFRLGAIGSDASGNFYGPNFRDILVVPSANLERITTQPISLHFESQDLGLQIVVKGEYSDGVERSLTDSDTGTTYMVENGDSVVVDADGWVTPRHIGSAEIVIRNGTAIMHVPVKVVSVVFDWDNDGSVSLADFEVTLECLSDPGFLGDAFRLSLPCQDFADVDKDSDVDLLDLAAFQNRFQGN